MAQKSVKTDKHVVYQMMFHLWGNQNTNVKRNGSAAENGVTKFKDISTKGLQALKKKGYSHLYTTGILEHATMEDFSAFGSPLDHPQVVKGRAGSPFAIKDYYDVNPFLADKPAERMQEFSAMLDRVHQADLKLVLDFVPNHLARVYHSDQKPAGVVDFGQNDNKDLSFSPSNNFYYLPGTQFTIPTGVNPPVPVTVPYIEIPAKVSGNNVFSAQPSIHDWFETVKLNYGVDLQHGNQTHFDPIPDTWLKMTDVLVYWTKKGVDGFRCDMAEMVPVEFWAYAIPKVKALNPEVVFIAEIYNPQEYRNYIFKGGFDYLYDKVGLYDGIRHIMENKPGATTADITRVWQQESGDFANHMLRFLENHDETRLNSPGFAASNFWSTIPGMVLTASMHDGPLMIYFGQEFGEKAQEIEGFNEADDRTTMFDFYRVDTHQRWLNGGKFDGGKLTAAEKEIDSFYSELLAWINSSEVIQKGKFFDLQYAQNTAYPKDKVYAYLRYTDKGRNLIICNFDSVNHDFNIEIPTLALDMMGIKSYTLKTFKSFAPPAAQASKVEGNRIQIPSNSAIVISL
ncbi:alpha-amylase family glycosyl hydrolase [Aquirufa antheringensis]|uniref:alpha-amylase family glycosyl hydrolase n=1 Tax=Aquirufa antheringensis TaxID=2516559 RepID=UPI0022A914FA|nr:alpha-amylase family glycosyl hydrolase [Aquirufa antheringensis]